MDVRDVAELAAFLMRTDQLVTRTYGEMIGICVQHYLDSIRAQYPGMYPHFETLTEAITWLGENYFSMNQFKPRDGRPGWNQGLVRAVAMEAMKADGLDQVFPGYGSEVKTKMQMMPTASGPSAVREESDRDHDRAKELLARMDAGEDVSEELVTPQVRVYIDTYLQSRRSFAEMEKQYEPAVSDESNSVASLIKQREEEDRRQNEQMKKNIAMGTPPLVDN
jgi:hypothetical protein